MNLRKKDEPATERWRLAEDLCAAAQIDTVYGDLYLQRAREFLEPSLSEAEFSALQRMETEALNLPNRISIAMNQANWTEVKALSSRMTSLKRTLAEKETLRHLGEKIYQPGEPYLDPFSPGLQVLAKSGDPQTLLQKVSAQLERLQRADADWQEFYAARRSAMAAVKTISRQTPQADLSGSRLQQQAFEALNRGEFAKLKKMADLMEKEEGGAAQSASGPSWSFAGKSLDLTFRFPPEAVNRARALGLDPVRMESGGRVLNLSPEELTPLYRHLWHHVLHRRARSRGIRQDQKGNTPPCRRACRLSGSCRTVHSPPVRQLRGRPLHSRSRRGRCAG